MKMDQTINYPYEEIVEFAKYFLWNLKTEVTPIARGCKQITLTISHPNHGELSAIGESDDICRGYNHAALNLILRLKSRGFKVCDRSVYRNDLLPLYNLKDKETQTSNLQPLLPTSVIDLTEEQKRELIDFQRNIIKSFQPLGYETLLKLKNMGKTIGVPIPTTHGIPRRFPARPISTEPHNQPEEFQTPTTSQAAIQTNPFQLDFSPDLSFSPLIGHGASTIIDTTTGSSSAPVISEQEPNASWDSQGRLNPWQPSNRRSRAFLETQSDPEPETGTLAPENTPLNRSNEDLDTINTMMTDTVDFYLVPPFELLDPWGPELRVPSPDMSNRKLNSTISYFYYLTKFCQYQGWKCPIYEIIDGSPLIGQVSISPLETKGYIGKSIITTDTSNNSIRCHSNAREHAAAKILDSISVHIIENIPLI